MGVRQRAARCFLERFKFSMQAAAQRACMSVPCGRDSEMATPPPAPVAPLSSSQHAVLLQLCLALQFTFGCITASCLADFLLPARPQVVAFQTSLEHTPSRHSLWHSQFTWQTGE